MRIPARLFQNTTSPPGASEPKARTKAGAGLPNPVPRFRRRNGNGKNPDGQGFKSGDFFAPYAKKYYSSLDGLDSRNGEMLIVFRNRILV